LGTVFPPPPPARARLGAPVVTASAATPTARRRVHAPRARAPSSSSSSSIDASTLFDRAPTLARVSAPHRRARAPLARDAVVEVVEIVTARPRVAVVVVVVVTARIVIARARLWGRRRASARRLRMDGSVRYTGG
jgi:hypothetical protein